MSNFICLQFNFYRKIREGFEKIRFIEVLKM